MQLNTLDLQQLSHLMNAGHQAMFLKDLEGRYTFINQQGADYIHRPIHEIIGKTDFDLFAPNCAEIVVTRDRSILESRQALDYESIANHLHYTQVYRSSKTPYYDASGAVVGLIGISRVTRSQSNRIEDQPETMDVASNPLKEKVKMPLTLSQLKLQLALRRLKPNPFSGEVSLAAAKDLITQSIAHGFEVSKQLDRAFEQKR